MLHVVYDARSVVPEWSGIGNHAASLLRHMVPLADDVRFLVLRAPQAQEPLVDDERVAELRFAGETKSLHTVLRLGRAHSFAGYDLYHSPGDLVPWGLARPWIVTMHDLMWVEAPELASAFLPVRLANAWWYRRAFGHAIRGAAGIIAISHATADAIARVYPSQAHKVRVIHHGVDSDRYAAHRAGSRCALDRWLPPDCCFSLALGQGSPYKNHLGMVRAFVEATRDQPSHKLVLVRRFARFDRPIRRLLERSDVRPKVVVLPYVDADQLLALYRHARMLLFASHYEGFGMPALEAMAMGTAVLASTTAALREVTGNAALHAVSTDHADLVRKIRQLDQDDSLRERLVAAGRRRAAEFSWDRCARSTLRFYREAAARSSTPRPDG